MPARCFSEVSLRLAMSPAGSRSLPFPFPTPVGEINLPHPSDAGVSREARPRPLFALLGTWAHRWIAGACLRCSPEGSGFRRWLPLPGVNLVWPLGRGLTEISSVVISLARFKGRGSRGILQSCPNSLF